jgi:hypothetical protein
MIFLSVRQQFNIFRFVRFEILGAGTMKNAVFGVLHCVAHVRTDISEEHIDSFIRTTRIGERARNSVSSN